MADPKKGKKKAYKNLCVFSTLLQSEIKATNLYLLFVVLNEQKKEKNLGKKWQLHNYICAL